MRVRLALGALCVIGLLAFVPQRASAQGPCYYCITLPWNGEGNPPGPGWPSCANTGTTGDAAECYEDCGAECTCTLVGECTSDAALLASVDGEAMLVQAPKNRPSRALAVFHQCGKAEVSSSRFAAARSNTQPVLAVEHRRVPSRSAAPPHADEE